MSKSRDYSDSTSGALSVPVVKTHSIRPTSARPMSPPPTQALSAGLVWSAIRHWWKPALPAGIILSAAAVALILFSFKPEYEASAMIHIDENSPFIVIQTPERSQRYVETQLQLIRDPLVLGPVVGKPEVARLPEFRDNADSIAWLTSHLKVKGVGRSNLYTISMRSKHKHSVAPIVNAVADGYFAVRDEYDNMRIQNMLRLLDAEKVHRKQEVDQLRDDVRKLSKQTTGNEPNTAVAAANTVIGRSLLADLQSKRITAEIEQEILETRIKFLQTLSTEEKAEVSGLAVEAAVTAHPEVQRRESLVRMKLAQLAEIEKKAAGGKNSRLYKQKSGDITKERELIAVLRKNLRQSIRSEMEDLSSAHRDEVLATAQTELRRHEMLVGLLKERYETQLSKARENTDDTLDLEFKRAELDRIGSILNQIAQRSMMLDDKGRAPSRVTLFRKAETPNAPTGHPIKQAVLAGLACFCIPFGLAVLWERVIRRVSDAEQLELNSTVTIVGETPRLPVRRGPAGSHSKRAGKNLGCFEESIDGLRTYLTLSESLKDMKVLAVTSATSREGKTSVAAQLAVSMARASGMPTLLIDGDMRAPDIHNLFQIRKDPGLADVLAHKCNLKDAIVTSWSKNMHLLPAGTLKSSPHKLMGNGALRELLEEVKETYQCVIIDTPPVLAASESLVMAKAADESLMCVMQDSSRIDQVRKAHDRLEAAGSRPIGTVLNGVQAQRYAYRYGTYAYTRAR